MGISLKTDMQMLGLSNPKMFPLFLRIMADCLLPSLGDPTREGGSPGMEQVECGKERHVFVKTETTALHAAHQTIPSAPLRSCEGEAHLAGSGGRSQTQARVQPHGGSACGRPASVTWGLPLGAEAHACQPEGTET